MGRRGPRFTPTERERLLTEVERAWCRGDADWEIAQRLEVSTSQVKTWIAQLKEHWHRRFAGEAEQRRDAEIAKVDELERTYWRAWIESLAPKETTMTDQGDGDGKVRVRLTTERRDGNPAFLAGVLACIDRRCRLLGLDEPQAVEVRITREIAAKLAEEMGGGLTEQDVLDEAKRILDEAKGAKRR